MRDSLILEDHENQFTLQEYNNQHNFEVTIKEKYFSTQEHLNWLA